MSVFKLTFIPEELDKKRYEYSEADILDLTTCAFGLEAIFEALDSHLDNDQDGSCVDDARAILNVCKYLIDPISSFLGNGAQVSTELREKEKAIDKKVDARVEELTKEILDLADETEDMADPFQIVKQIRHTLGFRNIDRLHEKEERA
jgi:hypothetical protein